MSDHVARTKNARGEGQRLRDELLAAAERVLVRAGRDDAVTLRAVAREAGVTAPSIYTHFGSARAMMDDLVDRTFGELTDAVLEAHDADTDPVERLVRQSIAYVDFAMHHPHHYRALFARQPAVDPLAAEMTAPRVFEGSPGQEAFDVFVEGVRQAELSRGIHRDPTTDGSLLWSALHGHISLRASLPGFPWPGSAEEIAGELVRRICGL